MIQKISFNVFFISVILQLILSLQFLLIMLPLSLIVFNQLKILIIFTKMICVYFQQTTWSNKTEYNGFCNINGARSGGTTAGPVGSCEQHYQSCHVLFDTCFQTQTPVEQCVKPQNSHSDLHSSQTKNVCNVCGLAKNVGLNLDWQQENNSKFFGNYFID